MGRLTAGWATWLTDALQRHPGRVICAVLGTLCVVGGNVVESGQPTESIMVFGGMVLAGAALLMNGVEVFRIGANGALVKARPTPVGELAAAVAELRSQGTPEDLSAIDLPGDDEWDGARFAVGEAALSYLLEAPPASLAGCDIRIWIYDSIVRRLLPAHRPPDTPSRNPSGWAPGVGAVGVSYKENAYVLRTAPATHDSTDDLPADLQEAFHGLAAVAAVPLVDRNQHPFGVISVSTGDPDIDLDTSDAYLDHVDLAVQVSVILLDLLVAAPTVEEQ